MDSRAKREAKVTYDQADDGRTAEAPCGRNVPSGDSELTSEDNELERHGLLTELSRRRFIQASSAVAASFALGLPAFAERLESHETIPVSLKINGNAHALNLDPRTSLLDALRENLDLTGTKKGCGHGQCGACTVLVDGRRVNSCLTLACTADGLEITTIEGLAKSSEPKTMEELSPMQAAFF